MKTAKEYYADVFEGLRMTVCGTAMIGACGIRFIVSKTAKAVKRKEKGDGPDGEQGAERR
jgi:hypothetical protein